MMKRILHLAFPILLSAMGTLFALPGDLTNKAVYSWSDTANVQTWVRTNSVATNYFKFHLISPGFDPSNQYPQPGDTIHIPFTIQNVGSLASTAPIDIGSFFTNGGALVTVTVDSNTPKFFDPTSDTNQISQIPLLASGDHFYYWLNITVTSNLAEGIYPFFLTNRSTMLAFPLVVIYSNLLDFRFQNLTVHSASDGVHTITAFDGTGLLGDLDVNVLMSFSRTPAAPYLYYDVDGIPDGTLPNGTVNKNRRVPVVLQSDGRWKARIPIIDPEIREGKQVNFIIRDSNRNFFYSGTTVPYSYFMRNFAVQAEEDSEPVIIANNVGDFRQVPVRVIYTVARDSFVNVTVYNLRGEIIRKLRNERLDAGKYVESWDARNDAGREVAKGLYFIHVSTLDYSVTKKTLFVVK